MRILLLPPPPQAESKTNINTLAKTAALPAATSANSVDTIITLPSSKKIIAVRKGLPADKISMLDKYFSTHKNIPTQKSSIIPNSLTCGIYYFTSWELENQYQPVPGMYLGIWTHKLDWGKLYNQYGFRYIVANFSEVQTAIDSGFAHNNIMINLPYSVTWNDIYDNNNPAFNYYYIDEPFVNVSYTVVNNIASLVNQKSSSAKLLFSDYYWPPQNYCPECFGVSGNGTYIQDYYFTSSNLYILCDQYAGNCCGSAHDFGDEYKSFYGMPYRNWTNWLSLDHSAQWGDLLNVAMAWSTSEGAFNPVWIYGDDSDVNEGFFESFANTAWQTGWLLRFEKQMVIEYKCLDQNPCTNCVWPNQGSWYIYDSWYTGQQQYISYSNY